MNLKRGFTFQMMADEHKKLDTICKLLDVSKADIIRTCVRKLPMDKKELIEWFESVGWKG